MRESSPDTLFHDASSIRIADESIQELFASDAVVKAVAVSDPILEYLSVKTTLQVITSYQGSLKEGALFDFYQDAMFAANGILGADTPQYRKFSPFNIMQKGKEYIVFAANKNMHPAYTAQLGREVYKYGNPMLGLSYFESSMTNPKIFSKADMENGKLTYFDVRDYEFVCYSKEQRQQINDFKRDILARMEREFT